MRQSRNDEVIGKIFVALGEDMRRCLICDGVFTKQGSAAHDDAVCHPPKITSEFDGEKSICKSVTRDDAAVYYVKKVMIPTWGNAIADDIKRKDVREWLRTLDYSGPTIGKIKGIMHGVYEYGMFEEFCSSNPCRGWRLKGVKSGYKAILVTPQQTLTIPEVCDRFAAFPSGVYRGGDGTSCKRSDVRFGGRTSCGKKTVSASTSDGGKAGRARRKRRRRTLQLHSDRYLPSTFAFGEKRALTFGEKRALTQVTAISFFPQGRRTVQSQSARLCSTGATCGKLLSRLA
jgi:hypothetical protein